MESCSKNWKHVFVYESGMIDPQPGYPSFYPGQLMFDNHLKALDFAISDGWELNNNTALDIHRMLTKNIPFFEDRGNSGQYRSCEVWIGHELCPNYSALSSLMDQWLEITKKLIDLNYQDKVSGLNVASTSHHMFEVVHPFIDGNGRAGRLLFQKVLKQCNEDPRIIYFSDRDRYYEEIQYFRDKYWISNKFDIDLIISDSMSPQVHNNIHP